MRRISKVRGRCLALAMAGLAWTAATAAEAQETSYNLIIAMDQSATDPWTRAAREFAQCAADESGGNINISVFDSGALGAQRQALGGILNGSIHGTVSLEPLSYWIEDINIFGIPYLFRDGDHLERFMTSQNGAELTTKLTDAAFRPLTYFPRPARQISSNWAVGSLDDLVGMKLRVPESATARAVFEAIGAIPTTMNVSELYSALETGVVDGQENPLTSIYFSKLYEVQKHIAYTNHQYQVGFLIFSESVYQQMSESDRAIVSACADVARAFEADVSSETMAIVEQELTQSGVTFTHPEIEPFREAAALAYPNLSPLMQDWISKVQDTE